MPEPILVLGLLVGVGAIASEADDLTQLEHPPNTHGGTVNDGPKSESGPAPLSFPAISSQEVVARALAQRGLGWYKLGGGAIFTAPTSFSGGEGSKNQYPDTCDCSGLVAYCFKYRRGPWNTDAIVRDALGKKSHFRLIDVSEPIRPSDIIVRPGPDKNGDGQRDSPGHVGIVTGVLPGFVRGGPEWFNKLLVTHCSGRAQNTNDPATGKRYGATRQTDASNWKKSGYLVRALHVTQ